MKYFKFDGGYAEVADESAITGKIEKEITKAEYYAVVAKMESDSVARGREAAKFAKAKADNRKADLAALAGLGLPEDVIKRLFN